jgi:diguanylate cyclase (GGDEF)-like protein
MLMAEIWRNEMAAARSRAEAGLVDRFLTGDTALHDLLGDIGCVLYVHDVDEDMTILDAIGAIELVSGYELDDLLGTSMIDLVADEALSDPNKRNPDTTFEGDVQLRRPDGTTEWVLATSRIRATTEGNRVFGLAQGLGVLKQREAELERHLETDSLTGLLSRDALLGRVSRALDSTPESVVLGIIDLRGTTQVNGALGTNVGDELLRQIGQRLSGRQSELVHLARLGGDEFGLLILDVDGDEAVQALAEGLVRDIGARLEIGTAVLEPQSSIGLTRGAPGITTSELLRQADSATEEAKRSGMTQIMHTAITEKMSEDDLAAMQRLAQHLETELVMWFQPIVDLATSEVVGVEALARWDHPEKGVLPPFAFLDAVAKGGLSSRLDLFVIESSARISNATTANGDPLRISVNITAEGLRSPQLLPAIRRLRSNGSLAAGQLTIELSERDIDDDLKQLAWVLEELRALGVGLSLDDYGTGFSSLIRLRDLPFTQVKMDRSFVSRITNDHTDWSIVRSTVEMAALLDLEMVAEGIEDTETVESLSEMNCPRGQGYLFAKPAPFEELVQAGLVQRSGSDDR